MSRQEQTNDAPTVGEHAVVLGGSIAGLLAARVLADAFGLVTVIERDQLPETADPRRGVPQGRHAHGLLIAGTRVLEELFPDLLKDFLISGVTVLHKPDELYFAPGGHKLCQDGEYAQPTPSYQPGRPFLEWRVREKLCALPNIEIVDRSKVVGLVCADERVTGAVVRRAGEAERPLAADLVVDATGRSGRTAKWLAAMGYDSPAEERLEVDIKYVSRHLKLRPGAMGREKVVIVGAEPGRPTGTFFAREGDAWMLTLIGYRGFHPPTDADGFLKFAESVVPTHVFPAIRDAEPLDDPVAHRYPASVRRRYDRLKRMPAGLIVVGDALCSFNPAYGQGMSTAALQAMALRDCLAGGPERLERRFFKTAAKRTKVAWQMSVGGDLALPEVAGRRPLPARIANAYMRRVLRAAEDDWAVAERFMQVCWLIAQPTLLFRPQTVRRVVVANWRRRRDRVLGRSVRRLNAAEETL